ncbi:MAG: beta-galactosidase [Ruminococcaceae bacterium]|nr:beta-galactosidase [Oscillospiraceae bacterium]
MIPRPEHPNPQFERENWINLNGEWEFELDLSNSGYHRNYGAEDKHFKDKIIVPFCPESKLSGIGYTDFIPACWYRKDIELGKTPEDTDIIIHVGACDYESRIFVNGIMVGGHIGGYTSYSCNITDFVREGNNCIIISVEDDTRSPMQARGKQSENYYSHGCDYTRTTGVWQTIWLEYVPKTRVEWVKFYPNINGSVNIQAKVTGQDVLSIKAYFDGKLMGECTEKAAGVVDLHIDLAETHLWEVGNGRLYDVEITFGRDKVKSYFGLRNIRIEGKKVLINEKKVFHRLVLDQGFYPDGIYTAPTEEDMIKDIRISLDAGFNGARLHQKTFEPRFLYHCDKMGYIVWGEYGNWGADHSDFNIMADYIQGWIEQVNRDFNHPSIVTWCPFNETWDYAGRRQNSKILADIYFITKAIDQTRPCVDTSGNFHVITDIFDLHDYEQNPVVMKERFEPFKNGGMPYDHEGHRQRYGGQPFNMSEYGGIKWSDEKDGAWGYGDAPKTEAEFIERYRGLTDVFLDNPNCYGFCYTQLYDVEQEQNGLYRYDRTPKFDMNIFKEINGKKAAYEET